MIKKYNAYWLHNSGKLIDVPMTHINTMREKPQVFGTTKKAIDSLYDKYGEKYNVEGKARREVMLKAIKKGWIRLREHTRSGTWYGNVSKIDNKNMKALQDWMRDMIDAGYAYNTIPIIISDVLDGVGKMKKITMENKVMELKTTFGEVLNENYTDTSLKNILKESSLSRLWSHNENHDCAALTAFRSGADCGEGEKYSKKQNQQRNKSLLAKLLAKGYGVTTLNGRYPEGGTTKSEISYFVVNKENDKDFVKQIRKLGEVFEQDSVLIVPQGAIQGNAKAYLVGTNHCDNSWVSYGKKIPFAGGKMGKSSKIYTSYFNGRPFIFEKIVKENALPASGMGNWAMHTIAEQDWKDVEL